MNWIHPALAPTCIEAHCPLKPVEFWRRHSVSWKRWDSHNCYIPILFLGRHRWGKLNNHAPYLWVQSSRKNTERKATYLKSVDCVQNVAHPIHVLELGSQELIQSQVQQHTFVTPAPRPRRKLQKQRSLGVCRLANLMHTAQTRDSVSREMEGNQCTVMISTWTRRHTGPCTYMQMHTSMHISIRSVMMGVMPSCLCLHCIHAWFPQRSEEGAGSPGTGRLWASMLVLGMKCRSSARTSSALNL